jgi:hypothetical protein
LRALIWLGFLPAAVATLPVNAIGARAQDPVARMQRTLPAPDRGAGVRQLTGRNLRVGQVSFRRRTPADPFVAMEPDGRARIYGTGPNYIEFASLDDLLRGGPYRLRALPIPRSLRRPEISWDMMVQRFPDGREVMYGGVMRPPADPANPDHKRRAQWPADNWSRRIYPFVKDARSRWQVVDHPLFNPMTAEVARNRSMIGHSYGHDFKTVRRQTPEGPVDELWLFHEEITEKFDTPNGPRLRTEIFARKMLSPFAASSEKVKILGVGDPPYPATRRVNGDVLVEGPRPFEVKLSEFEREPGAPEIANPDEAIHFISFSNADFAGNGYDVHFAYQRGNGIGRYTRLERHGERDLEHVADRIKRKYDLSWLGRGQVIRRGPGDYWMVFHAVNKRIRPHANYTGHNRAPLHEFHRNLYAVPIRFLWTRDDTPRVELMDDATPG